MKISTLSEWDWINASSATLLHTCDLIPILRVEARLQTITIGNNGILYARLELRDALNKIAFFIEGKLASYGRKFNEENGSEKRERKGTKKKKER